MINIEVFKACVRGVQIVNLLYDLQIYFIYAKYYSFS